jgi:dihydroorotate dehydrogenase
LDIYKQLIRPLLFAGIDPEAAHQQALTILGWLGNSKSIRQSTGITAYLAQTCCLHDRRLEQTLWNLNFSNPLGLAAGFDKDGVAAGAWSSLGFGFAELGTVTLHAQPGNPQPRLFRLPHDQAVLNRMGFNNQGAAALAARLQRQHAADHQRALDGFKIPIGINLGKSKITPLSEAVSDYVGSFQALQSLGDYFVVNVSSPNTPGLRSLQETDQLAPILEALQTENTAHKPLLVKIAPDLSWEAIADVVQLAQTYKLSGIIATNTTIRRDGLNTQVVPKTGHLLIEEMGGISGAPLRQQSTEVIRFIWRETQGHLPIIGVGGIFTADHAWEKITAGASLIQTYTGWIYEGPWMVRRILEGLLQKLNQYNLSSLTHAIGYNAQT